MFRKLLITICALCIVFSVGCSNENDSKETTDTNEYLPEYVPDNIVEGDTYYVIPSLEERTAWNIEITFLEITDKAIKVQIVDYDNQGFEYNPLYYILEYYDNDQWTQISTMNEDNAYRDCALALPKENKDYLSLHDYNMLSLLPDPNLPSGHYRLTKVLSGQKFSVEFDL